MREVVLDIETIPSGRAEWKALVARAPFLQGKKREDSALDWSFGHVICIAMIFRDKGRQRERCLAGPEEAALLRSFWAEVRPDDYLVGHNLLGFDLPFLQARSVVCRVKPSRSFDLRKFSKASVYDTMQVWANWDRHKYPKLETLAAILGLEGKSGRGDLVAKWHEAQEWERIKEYCLQDARLARDIYLRMKQYGM